ncbi:hypothetical protein GLOIN_2v1501372 [Rhizophagus irregularis DAOM 181602=DAOM 197198]|uniref:Uncharacterized protein n=1 Tax=Rhizophagus irregularis (strain DAOM 181602 / DAOM 197198 / MUCL 43194) TaxID=747089 RepID=A0A2P4QWD8_RHIID|nr:hypothetical protein GLOIN_2v1501372 [Rhizophagus irregularis DAOM 181602=DAOM 197198]POG81981.1 hypothetical protein GLOIN_2v1501372 [Rhizophagus irregularis DAOM 181602=DAOM 197198]|eukprot:XP_025188847.1 hypothetical protein GLOIN_2v1501372 [Rhizophagus irregularis DAOM 181602=DAOM 197198]
MKLKILLTNLSKTCFWLFQNGLKILIAACDTGAIEQLRVYVALVYLLVSFSEYSQQNCNQFTKFN